MSLLLIAVLGYLIGSISFARVIGRIAAPDVDLSETEYPIHGTDKTWTYRGVSASTITDRTNWKWGLAVVVLDALKALVPVLILLIADPDHPGFAVMAGAVMIGHVWPVWWRFRGGRGQSVLLGALIVIDVLSIPVGIVAGVIIGLIVFTSVYIARNMWPIPLIPWFWWTEGVGPEFWFAIVASVAYVLASRGDAVEEYRVRRLQGVAELSYWPRLRRTVVQLFTEE